MELVGEDPHIYFYRFGLKLPQSEPKKTVEYIFKSLPTITQFDRVNVINKQRFF